MARPITRSKQEGHRAQAKAERRNRSDPGRRSDPARSTFRARVLAVVRAIPPGRVAAYGEVAAAAGRPGAARAVGAIMRACRNPGVPCHRVIAAGGKLGGYGGSVALKRQMLVAEGLVVRGDRVKSSREDFPPALRRPGQGRKRRC